VRAKLPRIPRPYPVRGDPVLRGGRRVAVGGEVVDRVIFLVIGLIGFRHAALRTAGAARLIGVVLGPNAEQQLPRALQIIDDSVKGLVDEEARGTPSRGT
jgi:putative tricarboxylic transport membrane protein